MPAPRDAIATILDAFRTHPVVGLEEEHGDEGSHAFRLSLMRSAIPLVVTDILVKFGNSRYQDIVDRFIGGGPVADVDLKKVWRTDAGATIWDSPIYEDFSGRCVQSTRPCPRGGVARSIGGSALRLGRRAFGKRPASPFVCAKQAPRGHPRQEVLTKRRRALVLYGALHLWKQNLQGPNLIDMSRRTAASRRSSFLRTRM